VTVTRCTSSTCSAVAAAIVAADRWACLDWRGRRYPVCSAACAAAILDELVTVGGFPRRPAPAGSGPFDAAGERLPAVMPSERRDGTVRRDERYFGATVVRR
jgi:hypothetical protein